MKGPAVILMRFQVVHVLPLLVLVKLTVLPPSTLGRAVLWNDP